MDDSEGMYLGRMVPKEGFRVFIYGKDDKKKVVNSWDEFVNHMATGEWFSSPEELQATLELEEFDKPNVVHMDVEDKQLNRKKASK
jgi:hypothetical protein